MFRPRCLLGWVVAFGSLASSSADAADHHNVLMISVDDLKPVLGCYGDPVASTPNIDRLAQRGVRFEAAYCNQAVCSPSRNSLMTGLRPQTLGIYDLSTHFRIAAPEAITLTQHFMNQGYQAQGLGKIYHTGHGNQDDRASWSVPAWRPNAPTYALETSRQNIRADAQGKQRGPATESADVQDRTYADGQLAIEAVARLQAAAERPDQPFFLAVGFIRPHLPFVAPTKYWDLYDPNRLPMPSVEEPPTGAPSYAPTQGGELRSYSDIEPGPVDEATTRKLIHGYYAATSYVDAQVGLVLEAVEELQLAESTIVVLWGDHGWHLGDHGMWCKHSNYEQAARIPLIIAAPGGAQDASSEALVETVDLYPTLAELAGIKAPQGIDGESFAAVVGDPQAPARDHVSHVYPRGPRLGRAIRDARYRMVEWKEVGASPDTAEFELYDYELDPLETQNLAAENPQLVAKLRAELAKQPLKASAAGSPAKSSRSESRKGRPDRAAMFKKRDTNSDGYLTRQEFLAHQPDPEQAPQRFPRFDSNADGKLSADEFIAGGRKPASTSAD